MQMLTEHRSQIFHILEAVSSYHCSETFFPRRISLGFLSRSRKVPVYCLRIVYEPFIYKLFQFGIHYHQFVLYNFS
jgi:hypothetical protein